MTPVIRRILTLATCIAVAMAATSIARAQGSFTHEIPIKIPSGTHGMQPTLSLVYNSSAGNGLVGMGWDLAGLSAITRINYGSGINYDGSDTYAHSQLGVLVRQPDGTFRTKKESFAKFEAATGGCGDGPCTWVVSERSGLKYYYGERSLGACLDGKITMGVNGNIIKDIVYCRTWALSKVEDPFGNYFEVDYVDDYSNHQLYPNKVTYTKGNGLSAFRTVQFRYEDRTDVSEGYVAGSFTQTRQRLKWIEVRSGDELIRKYRLDYEYGGGTGRSRLIAVQEYGSDGVGTLPAQTFSWKTPAARWKFVGYQEGPSLGGVNGYVFSGDWNGNGRAEICELTNSGINCGARPSLTDLATPADSVGVAEFPLLVGDWDGDGKSDICRVYQHGVACYRSVYENGATTWSRYPTLRDLSPDQGYEEDRFQLGFLHAPVVKYPMITGDWNGDGKSDICRVGDRSIICVLSTGEGWTPYYPLNDLSPEGNGYSTQYKYPLITGDWNGDGKSDICRVGDEGIVCFVSTESGWASYPSLNDLSPLQGYSEANTYPIVTGDWNGDGKTDVCRVGDKSVICYVSTGTGWASHFAYQNFSPLQQYSNVETYPILVVDLNSDGRSDICRVGDYLLYCALSVDGGWGSYPALNHFYVKAGYSSDSKFPIFATDINADGVVDVCRINIFSYDGTACYSTSEEVSGSNQDLLIGVNNGLGGSVSVAYSPATKVIGAVDPRVATNPGIALSALQHIVTSIHADDGAGHLLRTTFSYADTRWLPGKIPNRRFLGFSQVTAEGSDGTVVTYYNQSPGYEGTIAKVEKYGGGLMSRASFNYDLVNPNPGTEFARERSRTLETYEMGTFVSAQTTTTRYDDESKQNPDAADFGNPHIVSISPDGLPTVTTTTTFINDTENWILGKVSQVTTTSGDTKLADSRNEAWMFNLVTQRSVWLDTTDKWLVSKVTPDEWGNPSVLTDELRRTTTYTYDSTFHAYQVSAINALGHVVKTTYDSAGLPLTVTDVNGWQTSYLYDAFGMKVRETRADGGRTEYRYNFTGDPNTQYTETETKVDEGRTSIGREYFDGSGFVYLSTRSGDAGGSFGVRVDRKKDSRGRLSDTSLPYFADTQQPVFVHTEYDAAGRVYTVKTPDGKVTTYEYKAGYSTVTDPNGQKRSTYVDSRGLVTSVVDAMNQSTSYGYDALGKRTSVTLPNETEVGTEVKYDSLGRKTSLKEPQLGTETYVYDAVGNIKSVTTNGKMLLFVYDALNRMVARTILHAPGATVSFEYDDPAMSNGRGRLTKIVALSARETLLSYTPMGQIGGIVRTIKGESDSFSQYFDYDYAGRVTRETYPNGDFAEYKYTNGGNLASVALNGVQFAAWSGYSATGKPDNVAYANGVRTAYKFDVMGHVTNLTTTKGSNALQNLTYDWYSLPNTSGINLGAIIDNRLNKTVSGNNTDETQWYGYDALYRLTAAVGAWGAKGFSYDAIGNPTTFGGVVSRTLTFTGQQLTSGTGISDVVHDADGNLKHKVQDGVTWDYSWTQEGRLAAVSKNGASTAQMAYDQDGQRVKKVYTPSSGPSVTTVYIGDAYEKRTYSDGSPERHTLHLYANGQHIASVTRVGSIATAFNEANQWRTELAAASLYNARSLSGGVRKAYHLLSALAIHPRATKWLTGTLFLAFAGGVIWLFGRAILRQAPRGRLPLRMRLSVVSFALVFSFGACSPEPLAPGGLYRAPGEYLISGDTTKGPALGTYFYHSNQVNSSAVITDASGNEVTRMVYLPFGEVSQANSSGGDTVTSKFTDQEYDSEFGLYYYGSRYYDPSIGRFISADSVVPGSWNAQAFNRYAYVGNNPVIYRDPTGHFNVGGFLVGLGMTILGGVALGLGCPVGVPLLASGVATMGTAAAWPSGGISPVTLGVPVPIGGGSAGGGVNGSTSVLSGGTGGGGPGAGGSAYLGGGGLAGSGGFFLNGYVDVVSVDGGGGIDPSGAWRAGVWQGMADRGSELWGGLWRPLTWREALGQGLMHSNVLSGGYLLGKGLVSGVVGTARDLAAGGEAFVRGDAYGTGYHLNWGIAQAALIAASGRAAMAGVEAVGAEAAAFEHGALLERWMSTAKGNVGMLAEIEIEGATLHLKDLTVFAKGTQPLTGLTREMLRAKSALVDEARGAGFSKLRITGERVPTSTSANPGKRIDMTIDLNE